MAGTRHLAADVAGYSLLILACRIGLVDNAQVERSAIYRLKGSGRH
jgi:hypothetical protein